MLKSPYEKPHISPQHTLDINTETFIHSSHYLA